MSPYDLLVFKGYFKGWGCYRVLGLSGRGVVPMLAPVAEEARRQAVQNAITCFCTFQGQ